PLGAAGALWRTFGANGVRRRATFELRKRFARLESAPPATPQRVLDHAPPERWPFRPNVRRLAHEASRGEAITRADRVLAGEHEAYRSTWRPRPATPDEWNVDPETGYRYESVPWFRIPHSAGGADIKDAWEPGRFAWAYDLARGWMLTRNDRYAQAFWTALERFRSGCPPYRGVQWACGQETAIRALALLWCEESLAEAPATTPARQAMLRQMLYWSGFRIADALDYAVSQRNNHGISECTGLIAIGGRFRGADDVAEGWWRDARRALELQIQDQFARDGWYTQHSFTYLRVALDQLVHAERTLRHTGDALSAPAAERVRAAVRLLGTVIDQDTGDVPNHGANDGAFVLPLTTRGFRDFRPSLTAAAATFHVPLPPAVRPDGETLAWLDADPPPSAESERPRVVVGESGWVDARVEGTRIFARAGTYRSRPSHIDTMHVDIWVDGAPVAVDAGTYRYVGPWSRALADERAHNTVTIDGWPMAERGPRFLWLRWPRGAIASFRDARDVVTIEMLNESWRDAGIEHRRTCRLTHDGVTVLDEVSLAPGATARVGVHWLLDGGREDALVLASVPTDVEVIRGDEHSPHGWIADSYAVRRPATSVRLTTRDAATRVRFASGFGSARGEAYLQSVLARGIDATPKLASAARGGNR
ncbi:MAG TPA: heparinase II/III family protein, partial [Gemmatimonadaceae bacterium]|nr:heparinase II/III family protein [Gemmatimonadaceae bacterium]